MESEHLLMNTTTPEPMKTHSKALNGAPRFSNRFYFKCVCVFEYVHMSTGAHKFRSSGPLELELQVCVPPDVIARNRTQNSDFCKRSTSS